MVSGYPTMPVRITQGLRRGGLLSLLLYNLVLGPLLAPLRAHLVVLMFLSYTLRILAYADDILVAIRDQVDLGTLETSLRLHAAVSNAKVNRHKSEMMLLNGVEIHAPFNTIRPGQSVRYLGVFSKNGAVEGIAAVCNEYIRRS
jgi:hypothetical protein